jgi:hypothetical protein
MLQLFILCCVFVFLRMIKIWILFMFHCSCCKLSLSRFHVCYNCSCCVFYFFRMMKILILFILHWSCCKPSLSQLELEICLIEICNWVFRPNCKFFYFSDFLSKSFHHYRVQLDATVPFLFLFTKITSPFMRWHFKLKVSLMSNVCKCYLLMLVWWDYLGELIKTAYQLIFISSSS